MKKMYSFILEHRKSVILLYLVLAVVAAYCTTKVKVNSDLTEYLPSDSKSTKAIELMQDEFEGDIANAKLMVKEISLDEAKELKNRIGKVEGVKDISWIPGTDTINIPLQMLPESAIQSYYKDGNALYTLTLDDNYSADLLDEIRSLTDKETKFSGSFVEAKVSLATGSREVAIIAGVAFSVAVAVMLLTLESWLEPFIMMSCMAIAIVLNMGSNLALGTISSVTNTAASVLQMAVSVDYFVFLIHRYKEYKEQGLESKEAMLQSMVNSGVSIVSSSFTTIIGFLALAFMRYRLGLDMGVVLSKGVVFSLLVTFTLLPCVLLTFDRAVEKTKHRIILQNFTGLAKFSSKIKIPMMFVFFVIIIPAYMSQSKMNYYYGNSHSYSDTSTVTLEKQEIQEVFGKKNTMVLLVPQGEFHKQYMMEKELESSITELDSIMSYVSIMGPDVPIDMVPDQVTDLFLSDHYSRIVLSLDLEDESDYTFRVVDKIENIAEKYFEENIYIAGNSPSTKDLKTVITADSVKINLITVVAIIIVLFVSFKSFSIPLLLTVCIEGAIWICMAVSYIRGETLFYIGYLIASSILLGATVDYAILIMSRYLEIRPKMKKEEATFQSVDDSLVSIFTSGTVMLIAGIMMDVASTNLIMCQLGELLARGALLAIIAVVFVLPGIFKIFDKFITNPRKQKSTEDKNEPEVAFVDK